MGTRTMQTLESEARLRKALDEVERLKNQLQAENLYLKEEVKLGHNFGEIVGKSAAVPQNIAAAKANSSVARTLVCACVIFSGRAD
jgi:hypothetical protein